MPGGVDDFGEIGKRGGKVVVIDPRRMVPFRRVFEVVEACGLAGAGKLRYQSPPVEGGGGSDWWWM